MEYGFVKAAVAVPQISTGECHYNAGSIISLIDDAASKGCEIVLLPELCLTSSNCGDLFGQPFFIHECCKAIAAIAESTVKHNTIAVFGAPIQHDNSLYNCAVVVHKGKVEGIVAKNTFQDGESRWFASAVTIPAGSTVTVAGQTVTAIGGGCFAGDNHITDINLCI